MKDNKNKNTKEKILNEVFEDQAANLRKNSADEMVKNKKAKNFKDACMKIKDKEDFADKKNSDYISEQELELRNFMKGRNH